MLRGDALRELVTVMDRLRSPGGCSWDAAQTHASLVPYALEEAYEVAEAIEAGDRAGMREELGDLLLQVVFHARVAEEHPDDPFDLDDVAQGIVAKLVRRHPHVFGADTAPDAAAVHVRWEQIKQAEKQRESVLDGIPLALGALARSQKVVARTRRAGLDDALLVGSLDASVAEPARGIGERLLALVIEAEAVGVDAETALRDSARRVETEVRRRERSRSDGF
ncbi:nucleoside triphosphate pyrophosphohydrolase [mine drainage metagenome]|uniref:Nucleoside triphosphate pyrophosphohydrolase n=1 Tax=mine drainage metagenome TaxID=410659 RepID=A0A1J5RU63_9ZZZZ